MKLFLHVIDISDIKQGPAMIVVCTVVALFNNSFILRHFDYNMYKAT